MERRVKERLIGAAIIVVLIVVFVPQLLSGPPNNASPPASMSLPKPVSSGAAEPVRNVTVDLNTSKPTEPESATADTGGGPVNSTVNETQPAPALAPPVGAVSPPASPSNRPALESPAAAATSNGPWSVQLGSFANRSNADNLANKLKGLGYTASVVPQGVGRSQRFRVRAGSAGDRPTAERLQARLKGQGHAGSIVGPGTK